MKRSEINHILAEGNDFIRSFGYVLPPFASLTPDEMIARKAELAGVIEARLGWDITDFGQGDFAKIGLFLVTVRNGLLADLQRGRGRLYAEKIMISRLHQVTPMHRHVLKAEDIINRGGGELVLELYRMDGDGGVDAEAEVAVMTDGQERRLPAGGRLALRPGESVTLLPGVWHSFWAEGRDALIGEVSSVNDDVTDNVFHDRVGRFSSVEEDVAPTRLLVSDYDRVLA